MLLSNFAHTDNFSNRTFEMKLSTTLPILRTSAFIFLTEYRPQARQIKKNGCNKGLDRTQMEISTGATNENAPRGSVTHLAWSD